MKGSVYIYTILALLLTCVQVPAQAQELEEEVKDETMSPEEHAFIVDAQVRARGEYQHGAIKPRKAGEEPAFYVNDRARLSLGYASNGVQMQISVQQAGLWGTQGIEGASSGLSINEAWGQINTKDHLFAARVGRQYLSYDNGRILGNNDWTASGNSHNALRLSYEDEWNKVHLIGSISQNEDRLMGTYYVDSITNLYKNMQALWYHFGNESFPIQASALFLNEGHETGSYYYYPSTNYMQTMGANISYNTYHFGAELEGYYQIGKDTNDIKVNAWMAALTLRYTLNNEFTFKGGVDYYSGAKSDSISTHSFRPTYSSYHNFLGEMQYFSSSYLSNAKHQGIMDAHIEAIWTPRTDLNVSGAYHFFSDANQVQLSNEIDLKVNWHFRKDVVISAAYACAFNTTNMNYLLGGSNSAWQDCAYIQVNFSPRILFHKW